MTKEMITIRKARLKDASVIVDHWKEYSRPIYRMMKADPGAKNFIFNMRKNEMDSVRKYVNKNIRSRKSAVYIAEVGGKVAGFCIITIRKLPPIFGVKHVGHINDLYVKPDFRGMKIASMFKDECLKWLKDKGMKYVSLMVFKGNESARNVYDKWGFSDFNIQMYKRV